MKKDNKQRVFISDWMSRRPYKNHSSVDVHYLQIANRVLKVISTDSTCDELIRIIGNEWLMPLSVFLTSYLEDIVSDTRIWESFHIQHQNIYTSPLPFYPCEEYHADEVHLDVVKFLIWYFVNTVQQKTLVFPENNLIYTIGEKVYELLDEEWETAPENPLLKSCYHIDSDETDYFKIRDIMEKLLFHSYLFHIDTGVRLLLSQKELVETSRFDPNFEIYFHGHVVECLHTFHTRLLNLQAKEWLAAILGEDHQLSKDITNMSKKINGYFLIKGEDKSHILLEHIASAKKFKLIKESTKLKFTQQDRICYISIVKWQGAWWNSGPLMEMDFDADLILDEKKSAESIASVSFLQHKVIDVQADIDRQLEAFLQYNNGHHFAFMRINKIDRYCKDFMNFYSESLKLSPEEIAASLKSAKDAGFINPSKNIKLQSASIEDTGLVFFNPKSGIEILENLNACFPMDHNPYYSNADEKTITACINTLLMKDICSSGLVRHWIKLCKEKLVYFESAHGQYIYKNLDILQRFWKVDNYNTVPTIAYTNEPNTNTEYQ